MSQRRSIRIFDTTLRDGEQSPGASMNLTEKLEIAQALVDLGVDIIEAGFPIASPGDFEAVRQIGQTIRGPVDLRPGALQRGRHRPGLGSPQACPVAADPHLSGHQRHPSRIQAEDGQGGDHRAGRWPACSGRPAIATTSSSRPRTPPAPRSIFSARWSRRPSTPAPRTVNIPDTVGYATPAHMGRVIRIAARARAQHRQGRDQRPLPQRPGPGRGQQPGRRRERRRANRMHDQRHRRTGRQLLAGRNRHGPAHPQRLLRLPRPASTPNGSCPTSRLVSNITGIQVQRNKAIVGRNAFAHEAGIHQDGMLKERTTYEIMRPEDVGFAQTDLVLGKHSGRAALADRAKALGYHLTGEQLQTVFEQFKLLADKKKEIYDADIAALIDHELHDEHDDLVVGVVRNRGRHRPHAPGSPDAEAGRRPSRRPKWPRGDGPVDAIFLAIEKLTGVDGRLQGFSRAGGHGRQGRPGRSERRGRASRPGLSRPRRLDRQRRSQRQSLS